MNTGPDEHQHPHHHAHDTNYRPDSASIIHAVATRRDGTGAMKDREAQQREQIERTNMGLLLHALHDIADANIPALQRRLVPESEVKHAMAVLRRLFLLHPEVRMEQLLTHCEEATARDRNLIAHLIDPFQLRHVLTFAPDAPGSAPGPADLDLLGRLVEHGPATEIASWFARIGDAGPQLSKSVPARLRLVFARACRTFAPAAHLERLSFETAVLTLRIQGVVGFEDTRLFFSLLKQIGGSTIPGLESYLQAAEVSHAASQHLTTENAAMIDYFRGLARNFDHAKLPALEQHLFATAEERNAPPPPPEPAAPAAEAPPPPESRRGFFSGLKNLGQSIRSRE